MSHDINAHEHDGFKVDLSIAEALSALERPEVRAVDDRLRPNGSVVQRMEIMWQGHWLTLCRTDLKDNVCTTSWVDAVLDISKELQFFRDKVRYGARIGPDYFAVIDSWSDG